MSFINFITRIFNFFHIILRFISGVFGFIINDNIIRLSICVGLLIFIIDYQFDIIHLLPSILGLGSEQEKEFITESHTQSMSGINKNTGVKETHTISRTKRKRVK